MEYQVSEYGTGRVLFTTHSLEVAIDFANRASYRLATTIDSIDGNVIETLKLDYIDGKLVELKHW